MALYRYETRITNSSDFPLAMPQRLHAVEPNSPFEKHAAIVTGIITDTLWKINGCQMFVF
jgi:hypothetical protein